MRNWSQQEMFPTLAGADDKPSGFALARVPAPAWALIAAMAAGMLLLPAAWHTNAPPPNVAPVPETQTENDVRLMEAVATHLARPLPSPMERVLVLFPEQDDESNEREEIR